MGKEGVEKKGEGGGRGADGSLRNPASAKVFFYCSTVLFDPDVV